MQLWEVFTLLKLHKYRYKDLWETSRLQMMYSVMPYSKKGSITTPEDFLPLPIDSGYEEYIRKQETTDDDIKRIKERIKQIKRVID